MAESNRVGSRLMSFILLFDCQEAFHCCLVVACSNRINMISIQCHSLEWVNGQQVSQNVEIVSFRYGEIMTMQELMRWLFPLKLLNNWL